MLQEEGGGVKTEQGIKENKVGKRTKSHAMKLRKKADKEMGGDRLMKSFLELMWSGSNREGKGEPFLYIKAIKQLVKTRRMQKHGGLESTAISSSIEDS